MQVNTNYLDINDNMKKICFRKTIDVQCEKTGIVLRQVTVTSLPLQRLNKLY
jgi:hypothetical protein